jgi:Myosin head (motor domain)
MTPQFGTWLDNGKWTVFSSNCWLYFFLPLHIQKPLGLLTLVDEESTFPNGTDLTLANKLKQHLSSNSCFKGERGKIFTIQHYAGEVHCYCIYI